MGRMYLDAMEFLEEERDAWAPYEALAGLSDEQLAQPQDAAHGWSGRDLMAHLLAWQEIALRAAKELAVNETSEALAQESADSGSPRRWMPSTRTSRRPGRPCRWPSYATGSRPSPASCAAT